MSEAPDVDPAEMEPDPVAEESMRSLLSHVSADEAKELLDEVAPNLTDAERRDYLKRWKR